MIRLAWASIAAAALTACSNRQASSTATPGMEILRFPQGSSWLEGALPEGWEPYQFERIPRKTIYEIVVADGAPALRARSNSAASAVRKKLSSFDPMEAPFIVWSWRIDSVIDKADCAIKAGDDCAARLMILYRYVPARESLLERAKFESAKVVHGEYPPSGILVYAWTGARESAAPFTSPYSDRVKVIATRRGAAGTGTWLEERRCHVDDYRRTFGGEPPEVDSVALMTDTDNTGATAIAWFRSLRFEGPRKDP